MLVLLPQPLSPVQESGLIINTGLTRIEQAAPSLFLERTGFPLADGFTLYDLSTSQKALQLSSYYAVRDKLRGKAAIVLPYVQDLQLHPGRDSPIPVAGISLSAAHIQRLGLDPVPWGGLQKTPAADRLRQILPLNETEMESGLMVYSEGVGDSLEFPTANSWPEFRAVGHYSS